MGRHLHGAQAAVVGLMLAAWPVTAAAGTISFPDFSDVTGLTLNGTAVQADDWVLRLTEADYGQDGSAYLNCPVAIDADTGFSSRFAFRISGDPGGGDGITFVIQADPAGPYSLGWEGGALGYAFDSPMGAPPSLAVEIDDWWNEEFDPDGNHVALLANGSVATHLAYASIPQPLVDGAVHYLWVDYDAAVGELQVFFADSDSKPATPLFSAPVDLLAAVGPEARFGFTGATGGGYFIHDVLTWTLDVSGSPQPVTVCAEAPALSFDEVATALPVSLPFVHGLDLSAATAAADDPDCMGTGGTPSVWYSFTASSESTLRARAGALLGGSAAVSIYSGAPGALAQEACGWGEASYQLVAGATYHVMVAGANTPVVVWLDEIVPFHMYDVQATGGTVEPSTGALWIQGEVSCGPSGDAYINGEVRQRVGMSVISGSFWALAACAGEGRRVPWEAVVDSQNGLFAGGRVGVDMWASGCNEFSCDGKSSSAIVRLRGRRVDQGDVSVAEAPSNDDMAAAEVIGELPFSVTLDTSAATWAADDPPCGGNASVWFVFTPASTITVTADTLGSDYDTTLSVSTGAPGSLEMIACDDDYYDYGLSRVDVELQAGVTYWFMVGAYDQTPGGLLTFNVVERPPQLEIGAGLTGVTVNTVTGQAVVSGVLSCSRPAWFDIQGRFLQRKGRLIVSADFWTNGWCDGEVAWTAVATSGDRAFRAGNATVILGASAHDEWGDVWLPAQEYDVHVGQAADAGLTPAAGSVTAAAADGITYPDFADATGLTLNGTAVQADGVLRLTQAAEAQDGSAYLNCPVAIDTDTSFSSRFAFRVSGDPGGGDGLTFVIQADPAGPYAIGWDGMSLGYAFDPPAGAPPSLAVEIDDWWNDDFDPDGNHIALLANGDKATHLAFASIAEPLADGAVHHLWVDYDAAVGELRVFLAHSDTKPATPLFSAAADLRAALGPEARFGFTGATGMAYYFHDVLAWTLDVTGSPQPVTVCAVAPPLSFDEASTALPVSLPFVDGLDLSAATPAADDPDCMGTHGSRSVWYTFTASSDLTLRARAGALLGGSATVSIYSGTPGALVQEACGWGETSYQMVAGTTYHVLVAGADTPVVVWLDEIERFHVYDVQATGGTVRPSAGALRIQGEVSCGPSGDAYISGDVRQRVGMSVISGFFWTQAVCAGEGQRVPWEAVVDSQNGLFAGGRVGVEVRAFGCNESSCDEKGSSAIIRVRGRADDQGVVLLAEAPGNDDILAAEVIGELPFTATLDTSGAAWAADDPPCGGGTSVWYVVTPASTITVTADTLGSDYDTTLSVSVGTPGSLDLIACNDDYYDYGLSRVDVKLQAGVTYWFMVGAYDQVPGGFLTFNVVERPPLLELGIDLTGVAVNGVTGQAVVSGLLTCNHAAEFGIEGQLRQRQGRMIVAADVYTHGSCEDEVAWTTVATAGDRAFRSGEAVLILYGWGHDEWSFVWTPAQEYDVRISR